MKTIVYGREALVLTVILAGAVFVGVRQNRQEWELEKTPDPGVYHLNISRVRPGNFWRNSSDVPSGGLQNFTVGSPDHSGPVRFEYRQDAGTLVCEGRMYFGRGSGTWTFRPNPAFIASLQQLGYSTPGDDQLFDFLQSRVTLEYARAIRDLGLGATTTELLQLRQHGVTLDYLRDGRAAGYSQLSARAFMDLKAHGIGIDYLRDLHTAGYRLGAADLITLHSRGVSANFAAELKGAGYDLPPGQLADLHANGIGTEYVRRLQRHNLHPPADELIRFHSHGVDPDYLSGLEKAGLTNLPPQEVTDLHAHGVNTNFMLASAGLGYQFTPRELIDLHAHGVSEDYLRNLRASGMTNLSAEQIVKLRSHGVE